MALAEATQTPPDLAGVLGLTALAVVAAGNAEVKVKEGWTESLNLYVAAFLPSGERKTPVYNAIKAPLESFEESRHKKSIREIIEAAARRKIADQTADRLCKEAAKIEDPEEKKSVKRKRLRLLRMHMRLSCRRRFDFSPRMRLRKLSPRLWPSKAGGWLFCRMRRHL